jgi:hypothetical protein
MKEKTSLNEIIATIFKKYNTTLFTILIVGGLAYCILTLASISQIPLDSSDNNNNVTGVIFNAADVNLIDSLRINSSNPGDQTLPTGRINPFFE